MSRNTRGPVATVGDAVLLLGRPGLRHVRALGQEFAERGRRTLVLDQRRFPVSEVATLRASTNSDPALNALGIDFRDVGVGWFSDRDAVRVSGRLKGYKRSFARHAARETLRNLWSAAPFPWVNDPFTSGRAESKFYQLLVAREQGFEIPETLLTNAPDEFRAFARKHRSLIAKSAAGAAGLPPGQTLYTSRLGPADIRRAESVRFAPVLFQRYVGKRSELRVTVVDDEVYAAEIDSQASPKTRIDWRRYDDFKKTPYTKVRLPTSLRARCLRVARRCGLIFAGLDIVRTPQDRYVFLEINSCPAWLWVEQLTGMEITKALADALERRISNRPLASGGLTAASPVPRSHRRR